MFLKWLYTTSKCSLDLANSRAKRPRLVQFVTVAAVRRETQLIRHSLNWNTVWSIIITSCNYIMSAKLFTKTRGEEDGKIQRQLTYKTTYLLCK